jgi:hypothetical protein
MLGLNQIEMAQLLNVDIDTYRTWLDDNRKVPEEVRREIRRLLVDERKRKFIEAFRSGGKIDG